MTISIHLEIHFDPEGRYMIALKDDSGPHDRRPGQLLLLANFTLRQFVNLGRRHPKTSELLELVAQASMIGYYRTRAEKGETESNREPAFKANQKKRFVADLVITDAGERFTHDAQGFGILSRDMHFYVQRAILALARYLSDDNPGDVTFGYQLDMVLGTSVAVFQDGTATLTNQQQVALAIARDAWNRELPSSLMLPSL